jgi:hypothetical protein
MHFTERIAVVKRQIPVLCCHTEVVEANKIHELLQENKNTARLHMVYSLTQYEDLISVSLL